MARRRTWWSNAALRSALIEGVGDPILAAFADGTDGFYFDFSKTDRLFQAATGGAPADGAGENIGRALDSHAWNGLTLTQWLAAQTELLVPGSWSMSVAGGTSVATESPTGTLNLTGDGTNDAIGDQSFSTVVGRTYRLVMGIAGAAVSVRAGTSQGGLQNLSPTTGAVGTGTFFFTATATTTWVRILRTGAGTASVSAITCKPTPGNHGLQATTSAQPKWQTGGLARGDGSDDNLLTTLVPASAFSMMFKANITSASKIVMGAAGVGGNNRCFVGLNASGFFGAGVGAESYSTVNDGVDARGQTFVGAVTLDGSTVKLYKNRTQVYSGAQSSTPTTAIALALFALNGNGTPSNFANADVAFALAIKKALTASQIAAITNLWGTS